MSNSSHLDYSATAPSDGYVAPNIGLRAITTLAITVSGSCDWQLEASLDGTRWYKLRDADNSLETFGSNNAPVKFIVDNYKLARVYILNSIGTQTVKAKGLYIATSTSGGGSGTITGASNLAGDEGVFSGVSGSTLQFKSLTAGTNVTLSSDANAITINSSGSSGVSETTFQENKNAQNEINYQLRTAADGYALASSLTGLEQTEIEHYVQGSDAFKSVLDSLDGYHARIALEESKSVDQTQWNQSILQSLDGYAASINGLDTTELQHTQEQNQINQSVLQSLDGYATTSALIGLDLTVQQNKEAQGEINSTILSALDAYGGGGGVSETTFQENKNAQADINDSIIQSLDGYAPSVDGYFNATKVEIFTANGTWTKAANARTVTVICIGAGGGGGSGRVGANVTKTCGGGGGGGGAVTINTFHANKLAATETVTVGTGGAGGLGQTVDTTNGNNGSDGGLSSFGTWCKAGGGGGGLGGRLDDFQYAGGGGGALGSASGTTGGAPNPGSAQAFGGGGPSGDTGANINVSAEWGGGAGGFGRGSSASSGGQAGHSSVYGGAGGGGGGGVDDANGTDPGGAGGTVQSYTRGGGGAAGRVIHTTPRAE